MRPHTRRTARSRCAVGLAAALTAALLGPAALPATATTDDPAADGYAWPGLDTFDLGEPAQEDLVASVTEYVVEGSVESVDDTTEEDGETVVTLASDILFDSSDATLSPAARAKVATLVEDVPKGAAVKIHGHTDTVDTDAFNQKLSEQRAKAVAGAVGAARGDLELDVRGFGESELKERESGSDESVAAARAENRRVEIRYGG
ncbi:OmpA family protein [Isoptericola cucumis]|uniref:OmpA family protein n=1 Tax=Isoptericola cucumis TaxID=1776856 RepID=UPI003207A5EB